MILRNMKTYRHPQLACLITETKVMVRVYIVQGLNLRPCDKNGDSDPYIQIEYGNHKV